MIEDLRRLLAGTFLANAPICPLSNITGEGFEGFFDALNEVVGACEDRPSSGLFRVWVEDVFTDSRPRHRHHRHPHARPVRIGRPADAAAIGPGRPCAPDAGLWRRRDAKRARANASR